MDVTEFAKIENLLKKTKKTNEIQCSLKAKPLKTYDFEQDSAKKKSSLFLEA